MSGLFKLVTSVVVIPGLSGVAYVLYSALKPYPDYVQKIYDLEKQYGGCKFGLVHAKNTNTGGYPWEAIGSELDKEDSTSSKHKLKEVANSIEQEANKQIQTTCASKPNQIVELAGGNNTGALESNGTGGHNRPPTSS